MENIQDYSPPPHMDASRPSLGFPLGTALLLIIIFSLSGIFSCCYHWEKHRSLRRSLANADIESSPSKHQQTFPDMKKSENQSVPVLMPGDNRPKFIALPCPCAPPRSEMLTIDFRSPPPSPPVKPPRFLAPPS
ncbi:unnamed protein product [Cochlearia groenlandica]